MYVIPADGLVVRNPARDYAPLPPEGDEVPDTSYWRRRLNDGDVTLGKPPKAAKASQEG